MFTERKRHNTYSAIIGFTIFATLAAWPATLIADALPPGQSQLDTLEMKQNQAVAEFNRQWGVAENQDPLLRMAEARPGMDWTYVNALNKVYGWVYDREKTDPTARQKWDTLRRAAYLYTLCNMMETKEGSAFLRCAIDVLFDPTIQTSRIDKQLIIDGIKEHVPEIDLKQVNSSESFWKLIQVNVPGMKIQLRDELANFPAKSGWPKEIVMALETEPNNSLRSVVYGNYLDARLPKAAQDARTNLHKATQAVDDFRKSN